MKRNTASFVCFVAGLLGLMTAGWLMARPVEKQTAEGLPTDWTHRHIIFSRPGSAGELERIRQDPRYWQQWYRQNTFRRVVADIGNAGGVSVPRRWRVAGKRGDWSEDMGVGATVGALNYPAKYNFHVDSANCASASFPDYVVFNTGLAGSTSQASIVAFDNLYSGCGGSVPTVYWAYNTGGTILTSPVLSGDGTEVAFAQTSGGAGYVVVLKWAAASGTLGTPMTLTPVAASAFLACTAPCMTQVPLLGGGGVPTDDTTSSVFPDYTHDVIWVGGASSWLHQVTGVFRGAPTEVTTGGFPVQLNTATPTALSSPVYDYSSGQVFVGDLGGFFYRVSSTGVVTATSQLDAGTGLMAGPIVDSTAQIVYVFSSNDGSTSCPGPAACSAVYSFSTNFVGGAPALSEAIVGTSSATPHMMFDGAFDSSYYTSGTGTGNLYVCGDTGLNPMLYRVPVTAGVLGAAVRMATLTQTGNNVQCSSVSDVPNPNISQTTERVFFSVVNNGRPIACVSGGCLMSFVAAPWTASTAYSVGQQILIYRIADGHVYTETAITAGTSGATMPVWAIPAGTITNDGTVQWMDQGQTTVASLPTWTLTHAYTRGNRILDTAGNIQVATVAGTSGGTQPSWNATINGTTPDGGETWVNAGPLPSVAQTYKSGTSGVIMDNTVSTGGGSQVYFTPLGDQTCATSGGSGGCAIQASQSALQ